MWGSPRADPCFVFLIPEVSGPRRDNAVEPCDKTEDRLNWMRRILSPLSSLTIDSVHSLSLWSSVSPYLSTNCIQKLLLRAKSAKNGEVRNCKNRCLQWKIWQKWSEPTLSEPWKTVRNLQQPSKRTLSEPWKTVRNLQQPSKRLLKKKETETWYCLVAF